jgi:hypothetical protein
MGHQHRGETMQTQAEMSKAEMVIYAAECAGYLDYLLGVAECDCRYTGAERAAWMEGRDEAARLEEAA